MKRHPGLRELSADHHQGLVGARRLRKAAAGEVQNPVATGRSFLEFWRKDTSIHFRKEEEVLLPVYARFGGDMGAEPVVEMLAQHARIRGLVMELEEQLPQNEARIKTLHELGEQLEAHIRLEERRVFPLIENNLPEGALKEIGVRLTDHGTCSQSEV